MSGELRRVMDGLDEVMSANDWDRLGEFFHDDAVLEYPQSGERFRGIDNIRAQFENYPALEPGSSSLTEVIGEETAYALTRSYTLIAVEGSGNVGTGIIRVRYPDGSLWWAVNVYEVRERRITRSRVFFGPDFEAPDWRAPYREAP